MDTNVISAVSAGIKNVIEVMAMTPVTFGEPYKKGTKSFYDGTVGMIGLAGENSNGTLLLNFQDETIFHMLQNMFGETFTSVSDEVMDAIGEFTNILCGDLKRRLNELGYHIGMATPLVLHGRTIQLRDRITREVYVIPCTTAGGPFIAETNIAKFK